MLKRFSSLIVFFILTLGFFNIFFTVDICDAKGANTLYVGGTGIGNYSIIQEAIDNSSINDTIFVFNGTYNENIVINKSINLVGFEKNSTIIQGNQSLYIILIKSSWINISRFTIQNGKVAIYISGTNNSFNNISDNTISNNWEGIRLYNTTNNFLNNNLINDHSDFGIVLSESKNNQINENIFFNNYNTILLERWSDNNIFARNNFTQNYLGISIESSYNNFIFENEFINCSRGVYLSYSKNNNITNNTFEYNKVCGIYFVNSEDNIINPNYFSDNTQDIKQGPEPPKIKASGFEIILIICAIFIVLILKKNRFNF